MSRYMRGVRICRGLKCTLYGGIFRGMGMAIEESRR